jgi:hypothetical protein
VYFSFKSWLPWLCSMLWLSAMVTDKEEYKKEKELAFQPSTVPINYEGFIFRPIFFFFCVLHVSTKAFGLFLLEKACAICLSPFLPHLMRHYALDISIDKEAVMLFNCWSIQRRSFGCNAHFSHSFYLKLLTMIKARKQIEWSVINVGSKPIIGKSNFFVWCNGHRSVLMSGYRQVGL